VVYAVSDEMKIIDLEWLWRSVHAIVAKRCETGPTLKLLLIN